MSVFADVDAYNANCPSCGLWRFEHTAECPEREPDDDEPEQDYDEDITHPYESLR